MDLTFPLTSCIVFPSKWGACYWKMASSKLALLQSELVMALFCSLESDDAEMLEGEGSGSDCESMEVEQAAAVAKVLM